MRPRIGVALQGDPGEPGSWSGVVEAVVDGLEQTGAEVVGIRAEIPAVSLVNERILRRTWAEAAADRSTGALSGLAGRAAVRRAGRLDGIVQLGSGFLLAPAIPLVTYEDLTVAQAVTMPDETYRALSERHTRHWVARQRKVYARASACCVGSGFAKASVVGDYGVPAERVHVVGFARNAEPTHAARDWSQPRFLFVGREWERKNGPRVLRAFARLREEHPGARLDLVGGHPAIDEPGVTGHGLIRFGIAAERARYDALLAAATCLVMPSLFEAFGIAHLDAAAAGVPSIGTTLGGAAEAIGPGGVVVEATDDDAVLAAMRRLSDPGTAAAMGEAASRHAELFSRRAVAERLLRALRPPGVDVEALAPFLDTPGVVAASAPVPAEDLAG